MHLNIENIGIIQSANINLNGLTVIAGLNDSGKSTIGKIIFSVIKSFQKFDEELFSEENNLGKELLYLTFKSLEELNEETRKEFLKNIFELQEKSEIKTEVIKFIEKLTKLVEENKSKIPEQYLKELKLIEKRLKEKKSEKEKIRQTLTKVLKNEFAGEISSKLNSKKGIVELKKGKKLVCKLDIKNNKINGFEYCENKDFTDATYIESPISFNYFLGINQSILKDAAYGELGNLNFHIIDLLSKMQSLDSTKKDEFKLLDFIKQITRTDVLKKQKKGNFEFSFNKLFGKKEHSFENVNTAVGIKSFSFIELLYRANKLNKDNLLIIDEPEVHLHPKWQIEYAKLLVKLAENGLNILITTHSPYMIEAINKFKSNSTVKGEVSFYLTERQKNHSIKFIDKTKQINDISKELSEPFETLLYE